MSDKIQNLSDAIRMGAALTKPGPKGDLCNRFEQGQHTVTSTCALGAALFSILGHEMERETDWRDELEWKFTWLSGVRIRDEKLVNVKGLEHNQYWPMWDDWVWTRYDNYNMTREQIAKELQEMGL